MEPIYRSPALAVVKRPETSPTAARLVLRRLANLAKLTTSAAVAIRAGCLPINFASSDALQLRQKRRIAPLGARFAYTLSGCAVVAER